MSQVTDYPERITKEEVNERPLGSFQGEILTLSSEVEAIKVLESLIDEPVLGFDTETKPVYKKGDQHLPALIQLATSDKAYLFQLKALGGIDLLLPILENPEVKKVGVGLRDDIMNLKKIRAVNAEGFEEIGTLTQHLGIVNTGLRALSALFLNFRISKKEQLSNWERRELTESQKRYAATDAWVSYSLYIKVVSVLVERKIL